MRREDRNREISRAIFRSYFQVSPIKLVFLAVVVVATMGLLVAYAEPRFAQGYVRAEAQSLRVDQNIYGPSESYLSARLEDGKAVHVRVLLRKITPGSKVCLSEQRGSLTGRRTYNLVPFERCGDSE